MKNHGTMQEPLNIASFITITNQNALLSPQNNAIRYH